MRVCVHVCTKRGKYLHIDGRKLWILLSVVELSINNKTDLTQNNAVFAHHRSSYVGMYDSAVSVFESLTAETRCAEWLDDLYDLIH